MPRRGVSRSVHVEYFFSSLSFLLTFFVLSQSMLKLFFSFCLNKSRSFYCSAVAPGKTGPEKRTLTNCWSGDFYTWSFLGVTEPATSQC